MSLRKKMLVSLFASFIMCEFLYHPAGWPGARNLASIVCFCCLELYWVLNWVP